MGRTPLLRLLVQAVASYRTSVSRIQGCRRIWVLELCDFVGHLAWDRLEERGSTGQTEGVVEAGSTGKSS